MVFIGAGTYYCDMWPHCWSLFIKDFHPTLHCIKGTNHVIAARLSWHPCTVTIIQESQIHYTPTFDSLLYPFSPLDDTIFPLKYPLLLDQQI
jgi:hypothetical protein